MTVNETEQTILLSQKGLSFTAVAEGFVAPPQSFGVLNAGRGVMRWSVSSQVLSGGPSWVSVSPTSGSSDAASLQVPQVDVSVDPRGLAAGEYYGRIRVTAPGAANSPQDISVVLEVLPAGANPGPVVRPAELIFRAVAGGPSPGSQTLLLYNLTARGVTYRSTSEPWLTRLPGDWSITPERPAPVIVQPDPATLSPGVHRGSVALQFSDGSVRNVSVLFVLLPAPRATLKRDPFQAQDACTPNALLPVFTTLSAGFSSRAAWPLPIEVRVADNCGTRMIDGSVVATFTNRDPPVFLVSLRDGRWSGTWEARNAQAPDVTITVAAEVPGARLQGTAQVTGGLRSNTTPPVIGRGAVVSAASFVPRVPLAPGSLISIFGSRLAEARREAPSLPLGTELGEAVVAVAGQAAPLLFASDGQINAMVPYGIPVNTRHQVLIRRSNASTVPEPVDLAPAQPAIFTKDQTGKGQGVILDINNRYAEPGNPVKAGDAIIIYCTGLGEVDPPVAAGSAAPASPLSITRDEVSLTIGGVPAQVFFRGLAPGFAGLYQVNAFVPEGVTPSDEAPVVMTVAGQSSPPVTIAVR